MSAFEYDQRAQDRGALVALGMILAAIVMVSIIGLLHRLSGGAPLQASFDMAARGPIEGYWWPEFSVRDTYAQWAMTLLALAATAISLFGVVLVRSTFIETRRTAEAAIASNATALRLGEAQVRAYVSWDSASTKTAHSSETGDLQAFVLAPIIRNTGQSPANLRILYVDLPSFEPGSAMPKVTIDRAAAEVEHELGSGNTFAMQDRHIDITLARDVYLGNRRCLLVGYGEYRDVFWKEDIDTKVFKFCFEVTFQTSPDHRPIDQVFAGLQLRNVPNFSIEPN